jgi:hypothetical protein
LRRYWHRQSPGRLLPTKLAFVPGLGSEGAVNRLIAVIPAAIVLIVAVSMGIAAALLGYPVWAIPLIAVFGAGGAIVAIRVLG